MLVESRVSMSGIVLGLLLLVSALQVKGFEFHGLDINPKYTLIGQTCTYTIEFNRSCDNNENPTPYSQQPVPESANITITFPQIYEESDIEDISIGQTIFNSDSQQQVKKSLRYIRNKNTITILNGFSGTSLELRKLRTISMKIYNVTNPFVSQWSGYFTGGIGVDIAQPYYSSYVRFYFQFQYCLFDVIDQSSMNILWCSFALVCLLLIMYCLSISKYRKIASKRNLQSYLSSYSSNKKTSTFNHIAYKILAMWYIAQVARHLLNISVFYFSFNQNKIYSFIQYLIPIQFFLDHTTSFILQSILLKIPYIWLKQLCNNFDIFYKGQLSMEIRQRINIIYKDLKFRKKYYKFRLLFPVFYLGWLIGIEIEIILRSDLFFLQKLGRIIILISIIEAIVVIVSYLNAFLKIRSVLILLSISQSDLRKTIGSFLMLILSMLTRIVCIILFYYLFVYQASPLSCSIGLLRNSYLGIGFLLIHAMPIFIVQFIYWPDKQLELTLKEPLIR